MNKWSLFVSDLCKENWRLLYNIAYIDINTSFEYFYVFNYHFQVRQVHMSVNVLVY